MKLCISVYDYIRRGLIISKVAWIRGLNYRFLVLTYRLGEIAENLVLVLMWTVIYSNGSESIRGFGVNEMITYILVGNLFMVAVRNFLPSYVSRDINSGKLSMYLVKPISYVKYIFFHELGRSSLATIVSIFSQVVVIAFFLDKFVFNLDVRYLVIIFLMVFLAFIIEFLLGFLIGMIAFWTDEVDGIATSIERAKKFFSGGYFPLNILPVGIGTFIGYLPFAYSFFVPAQLYLKKIDLVQGIQGLFVEIAWILVLLIIFWITWKRGLRRYEAVGQ